MRERVTEWVCFVWSLPIIYENWCTHFSFCASERERLCVCVSHIVWFVWVMADLRTKFLEVYSVLKSELLQDPAFEFTDASRQWVERVPLLFLSECWSIIISFFFPLTYYNFFWVYSCLNWRGYLIIWLTSKFASSGFLPFSMEFICVC